MFPLLLMCLSLTPPQQEAPPLLVVLQSQGDSNARWQSWAAGRGWRFLAASSSEVLASDAAMSAAFDRVRQTAPFDPTRVYLAGENSEAALVLYAVSRMPHYWAAAAAVGGNLKVAVDTNRLFAANSQLVPLYWLAPADDAGSARLRQSGFRFERIDPAGVTGAGLLDRLASHRLDTAPSKVDCETGSPSFARCYWIEITRFDAAQRNDALGTTRVQPGRGAALALGGFGYDVSAPGPGVRVAWLPPNYSGPLKLEDRILALRGKAIADARAYAAMMDGSIGEGPATVMIQRGREKLRVETKVVLPKLEEQVTARVQAEFAIENRELIVITRNAAELRLMVPPGWPPLTVNWNGRDLGKVEKAGETVLR